MNALVAALVTWAVASWLCGTWLGHDAGWGLFSLGMIVALLIWRRRLDRLARWVRDADAAPPHLKGIWADILTPVYRERRRNQRAIGQLKRQARGIVLAAEALPDGAITLDDDRRVAWCNQTASRHLGLNPVSDRGHSIFNIVRAPEFTRYARQSQWSGPLTLHLAQNGRTTTLLVQLAPYGLNHLLMVTRDVTQLENLETMRRDFVANVSHELRTPLTVLAGFVETLKEPSARAFTDNRRAHYLDLMNEQTDRMQAIVADLLTLSTLESSPPDDGAPVDMGRIATEALAQARVLSAGQHVFEERIDPDLKILGSAHELASAALNLLTNAVRYTPPGGTIRVVWGRAASGGACYSVHDTGIGIAAHHIPRLTERFYRVDRGRSRASGGTGLGLAITKHVAMRHDASLAIQSEPNVGSVFTLEFPATRLVAGEPDDSVMETPGKAPKI